MLLSLLLSMASLSTASAYTLEGPTFDNRTDATSFAKEAREFGKKGRVVRRYRDGAGWEFVVRFGDLGEEDARDLSEKLSEAMEVDFTLIDDDGNPVSVELDEPEHAEEPAVEPEPEPAWMEGIVEAHGPGRTVFSEAERVRMVFTRTLDDGRVARHTYARRGTDLYLAIEADKGEVVSSETIALAEKAWLVVEDDAKDQDLQRARETIGRFGPTHLMPMVLDLQEFSEKHGTFGELTRKGTAKVEGQPCEVYGTPDVMLAVGEDGLLRRVTVAGDTRVMEFSDYEDLGEVKFPKQIRILENGELRSEVEIEEIELDGELEEAWFENRAR